MIALMEMCANANIFENMLDAGSIKHTIVKGLSFCYEEGGCSVIECLNQDIAQLIKCADMYLSLETNKVTNIMCRSHTTGLHMVYISH